MPVEPCRVDLPGGRSVELTPAADFPARVNVMYDDGLGNKHPLNDLKIATDYASRTMERQFQLSTHDYRLIMASHSEWSAEMLERMKAEAGAPRLTITPPYDLRQRTLLQKREQALSYTGVNTWDSVLAVLRKTNLPDDTVIEWKKEAIQHLCCLDLDFHDPSSPERLSELDLERLGNGLSPAPFVWWISQGGGLHAMYAASPGDIFTAEELAVGAASQLLMSVPVMRAKGTVELKVKTRHPGALQKGKKCGPLRIAGQTADFAVLARFSRAEATEEEAIEIKEKMGIEDGMRLDHSYCRIDPGHISNGTPIHVGENGMFCHSCEGRLGRGMMTWGFLRRCAGMEVVSTRSLAPIREAFEKIVHVSHVDYLFAELFPTLPESFRRTLYRAQLKAFHSVSGKERTPDPDAMQRVELAFKPFYFVRGMGEWLHAETLLPAKSLVAADVRVLPSCLQYVEAEPGVGEFAQVPSSISSHVNNGRIPGWIPIQSYGFEPIFFVHNEEVESGRAVRCRPKVRTTRDRISYAPQEGRMPLAQAEQVISDYFPGINMLYVKALIIAAGCAESAIGGVPMLWATGPTEAAKTTTINIVLEMYGETFQNLSGMNEDRLNQVVGDAMHLSRLLVFDDFAKQPTEFQRLHTFVIRLNRNGYTHYKNYVGAETPPFNNAVIFTDWRIPPFFSQDPQFGRRVHLLRLDNRLPIGWDKLGRMVERWWKATPDLTKAASALHSWVVDEYFSPGDTESFNAKMARLGIPKLEEEANASDTQEAVRELVAQLVTALGEAPAAPAEVQRRVGRGARFIDWDNTTDNVGNVCKLLIDSLGKPASGARSRGKHDDRTFYTPDNLRHVLDPFQLHLPKMYKFKDGVTAIEFEIRSWGEASYIRLAEGGRAKRSKTRAINDELFESWPPALLAPIEERPVEATPAAPHVGTPVISTGSAVLAPLIDDDQEPIVILDEEEKRYPFTAHLDFESQSACDLRKHGSYVYAQHPSTKAVMAAIIIKELSPNPPPVRRIFWTQEHYDLKMPPGVEYEHGLDFLRDMVTDPAGCIIVPHNVGFERPMWEFNLKLPPPLAWRDTMDKALACGFPGGADEAGQALLGLGKDKEGGAYWMAICKPNKRGELPLINAHVVQRTLNYNFRDSEIGFGITERLGLDMTPPWEQRVCDLHHKINHWGIYVDKEFARRLREFDNEFKALAGDMAERITEGHIKRTDLTRNDFLRAALNANLPPEWQLTNMRQTSLEDIVEAYEEDIADIDPNVVDVIRCRLMVSRAAVAKVDKALDLISADGRAKAQLRYWGAGPGRFAGHGIQPHNMKRPNEDFDLATAITAVENGDREAFRALCKDKNGKPLPPYELLGSLTRGILAPAPGSVFVVGDFASIEARGLLWLANDFANLEEYRRKDEADERHPDGKDPTVPDTYQTLAGNSIFGKDPVTVSKKERGGGKIGVLACGYGGGAGAVERMALPLGVDLAAINKTPQDIVDAYRTKHPLVKAFWYAVDDALRTVLTSRRTTTVKVNAVTFQKHPDCVKIILPSGRAITYMNARLEKDERSFHQSGTSIVYDKALRKKVVAARTHGARIVQNITEGFCRDLLVEAMLRADGAGAPISFHVHDEIILEVPAEHGEAWRGWLQTSMRVVPSWAPRMPIFSIPEIMKSHYGK